MDKDMGPNEDHPTPSAMMRMRQQEQVALATPDRSAVPPPAQTPQTVLILDSEPEAEEVRSEPVSFDGLYNALETTSPPPKDHAAASVPASHFLEFGAKSDQQLSKIVSFLYALLAFSLFCGLSGDAWHGQGEDGE